MVRDFKDDVARPIPGASLVRDPFMSPDGQWIGFHHDGLQKVSVTGGSFVTILNTSDGANLRGVGPVRPAVPAGVTMTSFDTPSIAGSNASRCLDRRRGRGHLAVGPVAHGTHATDDGSRTRYVSELDADRTIDPLQFESRWPGWHLYDGG